MKRISIAAAGLAMAICTAAGAWAQTLNVTSALPHFATGGGWRTTWVMVNPTSSPNATVKLSFIGDDGTPASIPLTVSFTSQVIAPTSTYTIAVPPHGMVVIYSELTGAASQSGWTHVATDSATTSVFEIFAYRSLARDGSTTIQQGVTASQNASVTRYVIPFNEDASTFGAVALANLTANAITPTVRIHGTNGATLYTDTLQLPAQGHRAFLLSTYPATANTAGVIEFETATPGLLTVLGLAFDRTNNAFFSIPAIGVTAP